MVTVKKSLFGWLDHKILKVTVRFSFFGHQSHSWNRNKSSSPFVLVFSSWTLVHFDPPLVPPFLLPWLVFSPSILEEGLLSPLDTGVRVACT